MKGKLIVFEGPDGVGKSTLSRAVVERLQSQGEPCLWYAFPGHKKGTIGELVYRLHHDPGELGVSSPTPASLQVLHIAAHVDLIQSEIRPALLEGRAVVLDRFWWSTYVYGAANGVNRDVLRAMVQVERLVWADLQPFALFLVERSAPFRSKADATWRRLREEYRTLAEQQDGEHCIHRLRHKRSLDATINAVLDKLGKDNSVAPRDHTHRPEEPIHARTSEHRPPKAPLVFSNLAPARPTEVFDTYWHFAVERQNIFFRRVQGAAPPWTNDPVLAAFKFTNAYRAADRVSQYLIRHVIYAGDQSPDEVFFRTILFKIFNKIETWELLKERFGAVAWSTFDRRAYDRALDAALRTKRTIYSAAYIMPSGGGEFRAGRKHQVHLQVIEQMMSDELPSRIADAASMRDVFYLLRSYPTIGDFLAYQFATDLNYSELTDFDEMEFVMPGPGARDGIRKCFSSLGGLTEAEIIKLVADRQEQEFDERGLRFPTLWGRRLQLIDCQSLFCEVDKYARVVHPDVVGKSGRSRIKQRFRPTSRKFDVWFPPKWKINDSIGRPSVQIPEVAPDDSQMPLLLLRDLHPE